MNDTIIETPLKVEDPLLIIDEADELKDGVFRFIKSFYNDLEDECGIVVCGGRHLEKRIKKGVRLCKQSFQEIYSRMGGEFHDIRLTTPQEIESICLANGLFDKSDITSVINQAENDLRRVRKLIRKMKKIRNKGAELQLKIAK